MTSRCSVVEGGVASLIINTAERYGSDFFFGSCAMFCVHGTLDLFNAELFNHANGGSDGQQGRPLMKVSAYLGGASANMIKCRLELNLFKIAGKLWPCNEL